MTAVFICILCEINYLCFNDEINLTIIYQTFIFAILFSVHLLNVKYKLNKLHIMLLICLYLILVCSK